MKRYFMKSFKKEKDSSTLSSFRGSDSDRRILTKSLNDRKKGFTFLVKHFRSNPLTAMLRSRLSRFSQTKFRNKVAHSYGFTLAETLITLTILGIVAAITIPALINRQQEAANRTKVKKAMTMYEKALNQMIIENDLKTNQAIIAFGAEGGACANTTTYFKKVEGDGCRFKTADRIWWDISDIQNPLIILNDKKKDETVENLKVLAKDTDDITTYAMIGRLDETTNAGIVRINDNAFEQANGTADQKAYMAKLYGFINSAKSSDSAAAISDFMKNCTIDPNDANKCTTTYDCPITAENPTGKCTKDYIKVAIGEVSARECEEDGEDWDDENDMPICTKYKDPLSTSTAGDVWIADISLPTNVSWDVAKTDEICDESKNREWCKQYGDFWVYAQKNCEAQGSQLATAGELAALYEAGKLENESYYYALEFSDDSISTYPSSYIFSTYEGGSVSTRGIADGTQRTNGVPFYYGPKVVCVGK